jgi:hypothetical protein
LRGLYLSDTNLTAEALKNLSCLNSPLFSLDLRGTDLRTLDLSPMPLKDVACFLYLEGSQLRCLKEVRIFSSILLG